MFFGVNRRHQTVTKGSISISCQHQNNFTLVLLLRLPFRNSYLLFKYVNKLMYLNNVNIALHEANYFFRKKKKIKRPAIIGCFFFSSSSFLYQ